MTSEYRIGLCLRLHACYWRKAQEPGSHQSLTQAPQVAALTLTPCCSFRTLTIVEDETNFWVWGIVCVCMVCIEVMRGKH